MRATGAETDMDRYKDKITVLMWEFQQRFQYFCELETEFIVLRSPFTVMASDLAVVIQFQIIDSQRDSDLTDKFASADLDTFYQYLLPGYPNFTALADKVVCMFGTT